MEYDEITKDNYLLVSAIRGSQVFGLANENSDIDTSGIFYCPVEDFFNPTGYIDQINKDKNNHVLYEIGKFIEGLKKSNPNYLELLFTPPQWINYFDPVLQPLWDNRDKFLTKSCRYSFYDYATKQITKAKNLKKAININPKQVERLKTPLEYCVVPKRDKDGTIGLIRWLKENGLKQEHCGVTRLNGGIEFYSLYYDFDADKELTLENYSRLKYGHSGILRYLHYFSWKNGKKTRKIKYRGIIDRNNDTTQIRCSEIPYEDSKRPLVSFQFNMNAFKEHRTEFKRYWDWVANRNEERYLLNEGYDFDAKNMCHCIRLERMAIEIAKGKGLLLDRTNIDREYLLSIKNHGKTYDDLLKEVTELKDELDYEFDHSDLPEKPDKDFLDELLINIRKEKYLQ